MRTEQKGADCNSLDWYLGKWSDCGAPQTTREFMRNFYTRLAVSAVAFAVVLAGCGGSLSGSLGQASTAEGLFLGSTSTGRTTVKFVLNTGSYYLFYSAANNPSVIAGAIQGSSSQTSDKFTSIDAIDVSLEGSGVVPVAVTGTYVTAQSFTGTISYSSSNQSVSLSDSYYPASYQAAPSLATLAGTYSGKGGTSSSAEAQIVTISSSGVISGAGNGGCTYSGTAAPLAKGNGYSFTISFGAVPCTHPNAIITGLTYLDNANKRLYATGLLPDRTDGFVFSGTK